MKLDIEHIVEATNMWNHYNEMNHCDKEVPLLRPPDMSNEQLMYLKMKGCECFNFGIPEIDMFGKYLVLSTFHVENFTPMFSSASSLGSSDGFNVYIYDNEMNHVCTYKKERDGLPYIDLEYLTGVSILNEFYYVFF